MSHRSSPGDAPARTETSAAEATPLDPGSTTASPASTSLATVLSNSRPDQGSQTIASNRDDLPAPRAGEPYPLGATFDGQGTNFSVFSRVADKVELCLFDEEGAESRVELPEMTGYSWHGYLPGIGPGQRYGYRVHGPWDPAAGLRCNPAKLLLDPYARAIEGSVAWHEATLGHVPAMPSRRNELDSAPHVPAVDHRRRRLRLGRRQPTARP